jgi:hypothetical protein
VHHPSIQQRFVWTFLFPVAALFVFFFLTTRIEIVAEFFSLATSDGVSQKKKKNLKKGHAEMFKHTARCDGGTDVQVKCRASAFAAGVWWQGGVYERRHIGSDERTQGV